MADLLRKSPNIEYQTHALEIRNMKCNDLIETLTDISEILQEIYTNIFNKENIAAKHKRYGIK